MPGVGVDYAVSYDVNYSAPRGPSAQPLMTTGGVAGAVTGAFAMGNAGYYLASGITSLAVGPGILEVGLGSGWAQSELEVVRGWLRSCLTSFEVGLRCA